MVLVGENMYVNGIKRLYAFPILKPISASSWKTPLDEIIWRKMGLITLFKKCKKSGTAKSLLQVVNQ